MSLGCDVAIGLDEVGRGALAGPVMVGAVAIRADRLNGTDPLCEAPAGVNDSKLLTPLRRETLCLPVERWCAAWSVGAASNAEIDRWGIIRALGVAASRALADISRRLPAAHPGAILDGPYDYITPAVSKTQGESGVATSAWSAPVRVTTLTHGDRRCETVAAASIIAKVTRDHLMCRLAATHPEYAPYAWEHNKGYGSAAHRAAIRAWGVTPWHRRSWKLM